MAWKITANQSGTYTASTAQKYVDRDIEFEVPAGSAAVTAKTITKNPTISWDSTNKKIKATYNGSDTVNGSATAGWITSVSGATVSTTGTTSVSASTLDSNLAAGNIKSGTTILGVSGTLTGADFGTTSRIAGAGTATATGQGVTLGSKTTTKPSSGKYITVTGKGNVSTGTGWITSGNTDSNTATAYYPIAGATLANSATSGQTYTDISTSGPILVSGDYLYINSGYIDNTKISLARLVPDTYSDKILATTASMRSGYFAWDKDGSAIVGAMGNATVKSGNVSLTAVTPSYNSTSGVFDIAGTATAAAPTVTTGGYIDSSTGIKNANSTVSSTATLAKVALSTTKTAGNLTVAPTLVRTAKPTDDTWTDAANGAATTTKPTSGVYVQIDAAAATNTLKVKPTVSTAGYGDTTNYGYTEYSATVGAAKATTAYVPIKSAAGAATGGSATAITQGLTLGAKTTTKPTSGKYITVTGSGNYNISTAGWITSGTKTGGSQTAYYPINTSAQTNSCTATASKVNAKATYGTSTTLSDATNYTMTGVTTTAPEGTGVVYITIEPTISTTNGTAKADASASCTVTAGYADAATKTATATQKTTAVGVDTTKGDTRYIQVYTGNYTVA